MEPLTGLTKLERLYLNDNQISSISELEELTNLTSLWLAGNEISDLEPLSGMTKLGSLYLDKNQVHDISALSGLTNLQYLDLSENPFTNKSVLSNLTDLRNLDISKSSNTPESERIGDISFLKGLVKLEWLYLSYNRITNLDALSDMKSLRSVSLYGNPLSESQIEAFKGDHPDCRVSY